VEIFLRLKLDDGEAAVAVEGEQVEESAVAGGERWNLVVEHVSAKSGEKFGNANAEARFKPAFGLQAEEWIGVGSVRVAALKEAGAEVAAEGLGFRGERRLVGPGAKGDLVLAREGVGSGAAADASELQAMEKQANFGGGAGTQLDTIDGGGGHEGEESVDAFLAALDGGLGGEGVDEAGIEVADVAEVYGSELFAALIEGEELEFSSGVVEVGHALGGGAPGSHRNHDFEAAKMAARVCMLAAVVEPEEAEGEDAIDDGAGLGLADADDGFGRGAAKEAATDIGGAEAVFKIHGGAEAVDLSAKEGAGEGALQDALVGAAGGIASGGGAPVAGGDQLKRLRLGRAHAAGAETEAVGAPLHIEDGADEVAFLAPQLEEAAAVGVGDGVAGGAHVEENATVFKDGGSGVVGDVLFDLPGEGLGGGKFAGGHGAATSPCERVNGSRARCDGGSATRKRRAPWRGSGGRSAGARSLCGSRLR